MSESKTVVRRRRRLVGRNRKKSRVRLPIGGFPTKMMVRLKYVETFSLDPGIGGLATQVFRANSLFDPNLTGIGHQPSNYDKVAGIYDRYTVLGAKITVYPVYYTTSNVTSGTLMCHLSEDGTDLATAHGTGGIANMLEQPRISRSISALGVINSPNQRTPLTRYFSAKKFFGRHKSQILAEPYSSDVSNDPPEQAYFEVGYASADDTNDPGLMKFRAEIEYIALMSEPKITDAS